MTLRDCKNAGILFVMMAAGLICAHAQQPQAPKSGEAHMAQSGVLVGVDDGETLWIAPINGKFQALARDQFVLPRKDGFWKIIADAQPEDTNPNNQELWAVRLENDAPPKRPVEKITEPAGTQMQGQENQTNPPETSDESNKETEYATEVLFLSPDYLSVHMHAGEYFETYGLFQISSDDPAERGKPTEGLRKKTIDPPVPEVVLQAAREKCVKSDTDFEPSFFAGAEESFAIVRERRKWRFDWMAGHSSGAARGYHTGCTLSVLPPASMVGLDQLYPAWNLIKDVYPDALDAFASPQHDLVVIFTPARLIVAPIHEGKVGKSLLRLTTLGKPVMVQWATGPYVDKWTSELKRYFHPYSPKKSK